MVLNKPTRFRALDLLASTRIERVGFFDARRQESREVPLGKMIPNVYCPFCGIILLPDPYWDDSAPPEELRVRPWYAEVRGIYATDSTVETIALTGLGIVTRRNILCAPAREDLSYVDVGLEALEEWMIYNPSEGRWCFGFHGSCWDLLMQRLGHGLDRSLPDEISIVESVFHQFYCTPCLDFSSFKFGHDYDGAAQTHKPIGRPMEVDLSSHFYADPCAIPSTRGLEATVPDFHRGYNSAFPVHITAPNLDDQHQAQKHVSDSGWDLHSPLDRAKGKAYQNLERHNTGLLEGLSPEMKLEILSYLSFGDLLSIRLVCRDLASLASLDTLPQSYWRSRFFLHQEADFLFPSFSGATDWCRLFFATRASLEDGNLPLANRKRIRQLLEPIATIITHRAGADEPYGPSLHTSQRSWELVDADVKQPSGLFRITDSFSGQLTSIPVDSPLSTGCRVLHHKALLFAAPCQRHSWRLGISTVRMGARTFISGIAISSLGVCKSVRHLIGYHHPASEVSIEIPFASDINAIGVAFCAEGLTGIKFFFQTSVSSRWIGDSNGSEIAQGTMNLPDGTPGPFLFAGLDNFKIVSLGLGQLIDHPEPSLNVFSGDAMDSPNVNTRLWTPYPPMYEDVRVSPLLPSEPSTTFEPLSNIDFGGPKGMHLGSVTRLAFHMESFPHPLIGMEIFYYDGKSMLFGSSSGCMISLFVNGPRGERVTELSVLEDNRDSPAMGLGGLKVCFTNLL